MLYHADSQDGLGVVDPGMIQGLYDPALFSLKPLELPANVESKHDYCHFGDFGQFWQLPKPKDGVLGPLISLASGNQNISDIYP